LARWHLKTFAIKLLKNYIDLPVQCSARASLASYWLLASCLIYYAKPLGHPFRAFIEYICGCVLFKDVTVREIRGR